MGAGNRPLFFQSKTKWGQGIEMNKFNYKDLVRFLVKDKDQIACVKELVKHRKGNLRSYVKSGIFYVQGVEEIGYITEQLGVTMEEFGVTATNKHLFEDGFIVPVMDSRRNLLFYINYDFRRDSSMKYLNIYTDFYDGKEKELKLYGLHNTKQAIQEDRVIVTEGVFDCNRLEMYGIPAVASLGTKLMSYHKSFYKRFKRVIYIPDNDSSGDSAWKTFRAQVPNSEVYRIRGISSDVDEFGSKETNEFKNWVEELKVLGNRSEGK